MSLLIENVRVVTPGKADLASGFIRCANARIDEIGPMGTDPAKGPMGTVPTKGPMGTVPTESMGTVPPEAVERFDAAGLIALPGFIDIHSHGRSGADFCDATDEAFDKIGHDKRADGVTGFLATGLTRPEEDLAELCRCAERYKSRSQHSQPLSTCLGVHLEGPFFNREMAGAQNPAYLKNPDAAFVKRLHAISPVKKVSLAPELDGAEACIRELSTDGIVSSGGHSMADYACFERARAAGMTHLTHFCNAMVPIHHLRPSMVTGGLLADDVYVELITDGVHLSDPMIALITRAKGPEKVMVITDAMCAAGCPDGLYELGGLPVRVADGCARLANVPNDPNKLVSNVAGSVALYYKCFQRLVRVTGWSLSDASRATSLNQCLSLRIPDRGRLEPGYVADIVLVDADLVPQATIVGGRIAWRSK